MCAVTFVIAATISTAEQLARQLTVPEASAGARPSVCRLLQELSVPDGNKTDVAKLLQLVEQGVGFYNSDLPRQVKDVIERGMKAGGLP